MPAHKKIPDSPEDTFTFVHPVKCLDESDEWRAEVNSDLIEDESMFNNDSVKPLNTNQDTLSSETNFVKRKQAFDFLQNLAFNIRRDVNLLNCDENPHEHLEIIHESQNNDMQASNKIKIISPNNSVDGRRQTKIDDLVKAQPKMSRVRSFKATTTRSERLVSDEIIQGLNSILEGFNRTKVKSSRKRRSVKKTHKRKRTQITQYLTVDQF